MFDKDIKITGKHATYIKFLAKKTTELNKNAVSAEIFKRMYPTPVNFVFSVLPTFVTE